MIAWFLKAEIDSDYWSRYFQDLPRFHLTEAMIRNPDWENRVENEYRSALLSSYRGWGDRDRLFYDWPEDLEWSLVTIDKSDLENVRYLDEPDWRALTGNTLKVSVGASRIAKGDLHVPMGIRGYAVRQIALKMVKGLPVPRLIMIGKKDASEMVVVEGNTRITAYQLSGSSREINVLFGSSSKEKLKAWHWYPPDESFISA